MDEAKERGKDPPPTGEGVVLLQSTYRHPVQTTLVPHTNVCTYVCGHTRVFSVDAPDPGAPPSSPTALSAIPVVVVVVPLLIIRMMGRHTLELKLRDVSSADELPASTTPQPSVIPTTRSSNRASEGWLYIRLSFVKRD